MILEAPVSQNTFLPIINDFSNTALVPGKKGCMCDSNFGFYQSIRSMIIIRSLNILTPKLFRILELSFIISKRSTIQPGNSEIS